MKLLERCIECDQPTGRAGKGEDSIYAADGTGPYCESCRPDSPDDRPEANSKRPRMTSEERIAYYEKTNAEQLALIEKLERLIKKHNLRDE